MGIINGAHQHLYLHHILYEGEIAAEFICINCHRKIGMTIETYEAFIDTIPNARHNQQKFYDALELRIVRSRTGNLHPLYLYKLKEHSVNEAPFIRHESGRLVEYAVRVIKE